MGNRAQPGGKANGPAGVRFGPFELDLRAGELLKNGRRIRLQEQPFQILRMLVETPGELISREELRGRLWPDDTVVEFDHSINAAVKRLRDALRDSPERPRYIETVARRGYRFIAAVERAARPMPPEPAAAIPNPGLERVPGRAPPRRRRWLVPTAVLAAIGLLLAARAVTYRRSGEPLHPLTRLDLEIASEDTPRGERGTSVIVSPDGSRLVYAAQSRLFVRRLDQATSTELPGTERAHSPFFSPDGQWVAFFSTNRLKRISLENGRVIDLGRAELGDGGSWGEDGSMVAANSVSLSRITAATGASRALTTLAPGEIAHRWPQILPGGKAVLFSAYRSMTGSEGATIEAQSLGDGRRKTLVRGGTFGRYLPSGHLVYLNQGTLFAVPFDPDKLELHGTPTAVLQEVAYSAAYGSGQIDFSRTGTAVYQSSRAGAGLVTVQWLDAAGNARPLLPVPGNYLSPALSRDTSRLALTSSGDIWVYALGRESMTRLTFGGGYGNPVWTPDGRFVVFRAARGMWWAPADGTGGPQPLTQSDHQQVPWSFTPDGKRLAFVDIVTPGEAILGILPVETDRSTLRAGQPEVLLRKPYPVRAPMISPDGRWFAYMSNEKGPYRVSVAALDGGGREWQITGDGGTYPAWSRHGNEIYFWQFDEQRPRNQLMAISWRANGNEFVAGKPRPWTGRTMASFSTTRSYDPAPDGRIVALLPADPPAARHDHVTFLLNFFDDLRRRIPPI